MKRPKKTKHKFTMVDIFAGAGGLSEGFIRAGFEAVAHVEMDKAACNTLKTRMVYHWLKSRNKFPVYYSYLEQKISRQQLYEQVPKAVLNSVINTKINPELLEGIFSHIDDLLNGRRLDLLIGGPPCQAYSLVGRSRDKNRMKGDERNYLFTQYAEFLKRYMPTYFVFENVEGLLSAKDEVGVLYFDKMKQRFSDLGYSIEYRVLKASDYGIPQDRKRIVLVGHKGGEAGFYPFPEKSVSDDFCINDLFADLPSLRAGQGKVFWGGSHAYPNRSCLMKKGILSPDLTPPLTFHVARPHIAQDLEIYRKVVAAWDKDACRPNYNDFPDSLKTHRNRTAFIDRFKVVAGNRTASHTVVAHIAKDGHYYIHPDIEQNRSLTPREAARLQTFPDDYFFEGVSETPGRTASYKQIGNAVPVLLAQQIAEKLLENW
ncbi:MAG: DNA (cytosine-5-)-methyltransferase [Kiritimatiellae bacterium]|nr:DNA (cytosine-5-)-methyltransferase [Kiritimatiellia bacterium]